MIALILSILAILISIANVVFVILRERRRARILFKIANRKSNFKHGWAVYDCDGRVMGYREPKEEQDV